MNLSEHCSAIYSSQEKEATKETKVSMNINGWMDKEEIHVYNGLLLSHKKETELSHLNWGR